LAPGVVRKDVLDIPSLRPAVLPEELRSLLADLLGFRHLFRHAYELKLDEAKTVALWKRWSVESVLVKQSLTHLADELEQIGTKP
jgi:hypothetical protein